MGYIDEQTVAQLMSLVPETEVVAAVAEIDLTEDDAAALEANMIMLAGCRDRQLWPAVPAWLHIEGQILREQASAAVQTLAAAEAAAGSAVMRDSITMMLELIHASGDPAVMANAADDWLWGPVGPPIPGDFGDLRADRRYGEHAGRSGKSWDMSTADAFENHDAAVCDAALQAALAAVESLPEAELAAFGALNATSDDIDDGFEIAAALPHEQWPAEQMAEYSRIGWEAVDVIRAGVDAALDAAAGLAVISVLDSDDTYEGRGLLIPAERARTEALRRWFDFQGPQQPPGDAAVPASVSFWAADTDPLGFWAAAFTAARMQVGRSYADGAPAGAADTLLNRC